jgi:Rhodanese-related sulfurtransferase
MNILFIVLAIIIIFFALGKINNRGVTQMNVETAQELIKDSAVTVLDVRTPQEFGQGYIKGARLIPVAEISGRINELASLKDRQILVYCHSGNRSTTAGRILLKNGFKKVANLSGGIAAWKNAGYKIIK